MSETSKTIELGALRLEYLVYGKGSEVIICLHGHGRPASDFSFLENPERTVISVFLFYHGNSFFPVDRIEKHPLKTSEFVELFELLLQQENIGNFHLFAFSQGGRFTLCLIPSLAERIKTITLIAPDGMDNQSFYNWSSRQKWARKLFVHYEKNPSRLLKVSKLAVKLNLMRPKVREFVDQFASDAKSFRRASYTWRAFRNLQPDNKKIASALKKYKIPFRIIMGSYDQVIRPKQAYFFAKNIEQEDCVVEIENGHNFFKNSSIPKFDKLLLFNELGS